MMVGCAISDPTAALAVAPALMIPLMLLAGFFVDLSTIPTWFSWLQYLSPFKYGFEMLVVNEFSGLPIDCEPSVPICPISSGDDVLTYFGLTVRNIGVGIVALLVISFGLHILACGFLHLAYALMGREERARGAIERREQDRALTDGWAAHAARRSCTAFTAAGTATCGPRPPVNSLACRPTLHMSHLHAPMSILTHACPESFHVTYTSSSNVPTDHRDH